MHFSVSFLLLLICPHYNDQLPNDLIKNDSLSKIFINCAIRTALAQQTRNINFDRLKKTFICLAPLSQKTIFSIVFGVTWKKCGIDIFGGDTIVY